MRNRQRESSDIIFYEEWNKEVCALNYGEKLVSPWRFMTAVERERERERMNFLCGDIAINLSLDERLPIFEKLLSIIIKYGKFLNAIRTTKFSKSERHEIMDRFIKISSVKF